MARKQVGAPPSDVLDAAPKGYVDARVSDGGVLVGPLFGAEVFAYGTSIINGAAAPGGQGYADLFAAAIGASALHNASSGGSNTPSLPYQYADHATGKWIPGTSAGVVLLEAGIGEALSEISGREAHFRRTFESQVLTALRWFRASAVRRADHASITLGSGATTETVDVSGIALAPGIKLNADNEPFTITVEPGVREIVVLASPWRRSAETPQSTPGENGAYTITVNGVTRTATTLGFGDARNDSDAVLTTLSSERITEVREGDTIVVEKDGAGTAWFWGYLEMAATVVPPIVLISAIDVPDNVADAAIYREILGRVASSPEFAGGVAVASPASLLVAADIDADDTHPDASGHVKMAQSVVAAALVAGFGDGDVRGPSSAVNNRIAVFDGITGRIIKDGGVAIASLAEKYVPVRSITASDTLVLDDAGKAIEATHASTAIVVTVPPNSAVAFPIGTVIEVGRFGAASVTIAAGAGVTINSAGGLLAARAQYSSMSLRKRGTDLWQLAGDLG